MKKLLWLLYQPYKFFVFMPVLVASTTLISAVIMLLIPVVGARVAGSLAVVWARLNSYLTPMLLTVEGRGNIDKNQSYVIVANHQSHFDILVLYGWMGIDFKWVMKMELRKVPVIGIACDRLGHIYIDRSNTEAAIGTIREARRKITGGTSVVFFPEGTRSRTGELLRFKKGAFKMAIDLGIPILPVTITGTRDILPPHTVNLFPGRAHMRIHPPIDTTHYSADNLGPLMETARQLLDPAQQLPG
ncbi:MAG: lysophospholipid acyltransferase family protein [Pseudomonadota bacterium]